jgi:1-deoxy-D-xylulose-5-phosphate reductoisomerase
MAVVLNAANEIAVDAFLDGRIGFTGIPSVIARAMAAHAPAPVHTLAEVREVDARARGHARSLVSVIALGV